MTNFDSPGFAIRATGSEVEAQYARFTAEGATTAQMAQNLTEFATRPRGTFITLMAKREASRAKGIEGLVLDRALNLHILLSNHLGLTK
jgi:hypothetical protein